MGMAYFDYNHLEQSCIYQNMLIGLITYHTVDQGLKTIYSSSFSLVHWKSRYVPSFEELPIYFLLVENQQLFELRHDILWYWDGLNSFRV
jgi:hypothetical protein